MPFDPAQPATNSALSSAVMRSQLTSLKALIDAILTVTAAQVDGTTTLNPGDPATAAVSVDGNTLRFTFGIPQGSSGAQGNEGPQGGTGPQGPPFAQAVVDGVTTLAPGDPATVTVTFDGSIVHFTFGIPQGSPGAQGETGPPGEVSASQLAAEIATTALNPTSISPLSQGAYSDYDQGQMQAVMDKLDEMLAALKRA